ncbi:MAG TPA: hypothetical protein DIC64_04375 [Alphaproteobacteria bacterium]|nr:hypothetical protein [Alphaproteobacteria bacterium]
MKTIAKLKEKVNPGLIVLTVEVLAVLIICIFKIRGMVTIGWEADPVPLGNVWMIGGLIIFLPPLFAAMSAGERVFQILGGMALWMSLGFFVVAGYTGLAALMMDYPTSAISQPWLMGGITTIVFLIGGLWLMGQE